MHSDVPQSLVPLLRSAHYVTVLTGAGISAESGIPTFRDKLSGLWSSYRPEDFATPAAFHKNPLLVWQWYAQSRHQMRAAVPNAAHMALVALERQIPNFTLLTQNIDGLHQRAGSSAVIELHGNIFRMKCSHDDLPVETWQETDAEPPRCPRCNNFIRPDVVWFGERLADEHLERAEQAIKRCDIFFSIGTSGEVEPAASFAARALTNGAHVVVNNLDVHTSEARWLYKINAPAGQFLPQLIQATWPDISVTQS